MNFAKLIKLLENKDEIAGARLKSTQDAEGPRGYSQSPIGKSNYNPEKRKPGISYTSPDASAVTGTVSDPVGSRSDKVLMRYCLRLVSSFDDLRLTFGKTLAQHVQYFDEMRIIRKRIEGMLNELSDINRYLARQYASSTPDLERIEKLNKDATELEESIAEYEARATAIQKTISSNLKSRHLEETLGDIVKEAAQRLITKLPDITKKDIKKATSLQDLDAGALGITDIEELMLLKDTVTKESFNPFKKFYNVVMGQRQDAEKQGRYYWFIDPLFQLSTAYKTESIKTFLKGVGGIQNSHILRKQAASNLGSKVVEVLNFIKSTAFRNSLGRKDSFGKMFNILKKKLGESNLSAAKIEQILRVVEQMNMGEASEADAVKTIYRINENFRSFNIIVERYLHN